VNGAGNQQNYPSNYENKTVAFLMRSLIFLRAKAATAFWAS